MQEPREIPVWVEAIVTLTITPEEDADGNPEWSLTDITPAAAAAFPNADIVQACTVDRVEHVMNQHAADLADVVREARRMLNVVIGAVENGFSNHEETVTALRNILATLPRAESRLSEVGARIEESEG